MSQVLIEGANSIDRINEILDLYPHTKILLVTGRNSYQSCGAKEKLDALLSDRNVIPFSDFTPNPKDNDVIKGVNLFNTEGCDLILVVGGGSPLDIAKLIKYYAHEKVLFNHSLAKRSGKINSIPLIAIPTTAGSGSEATHFAVLYIEDVKHSIADQSILPDVVILEPSFLINSPKHITRCSGIDAFCQSIESIWNIYSTDESSIMAKEALNLMIKNLQTHLDQPSIDTANAIQKGSYLAGKAINITKTTAPHAMSYALTSKFDICHGQAVAVYLPTALELNARVDETTVANNTTIETVKAAMDIIYQAFNVVNEHECSVAIRKFIESIGLKTTLNELGVKLENRDELLATVNLERLANNPRKLSKQDLYTIFQESL
jgi:alcohol dehydrogenase class IV